MSGYFHTPATLPLEKQCLLPLGYEDAWAL